jgi:uncharacterized protein YgiM (DUF1202 family)
MRIAVVAAIVIAISTTAHADSARTIKRTSFRPEPDRSAKAIEKIPEGTELVVIDKSPDGAWLEVLYSGRNGWVSANDVKVTVEEEVPVEVETPKVTERHGIRAGVWVGNSRYHHRESPPSVIVKKARANLIDRPNDSGRPVAAAQKGDRLLVSRASKDGQWFLVELSGQRVAWVPSSQVVVAAADESADEAVTRALSTTGPTSGTIVVEAPRVLHKTRFIADAGGAIGQIEQRLTSNGHGSLSNYGDKTGLAGAEVALTLDRALGNWMIGVSAGYRYAGGADVTAATANGPVTLGMRSHDLEGVAEIGYRFAVLDGLLVSARAGMRMILDLIDKDYVVAVPSERILALTIGLAIDVPRVWAGLGFSAGFNYLPVGSRTETANLGDGTDSGTSGYSATATISYAFTDLFGAFVTGRFTRMSTHFEGAADRDPSITVADRTSTIAAAALGVRLRY